MYDCEICGKKTDTLYIIDVEGAELATCANCSEGKSVIDTVEPNTKGTSQKGKPLVTPLGPQEEMVDNYGNEIRKARDALGIPLAVLAEMINEKESTLNRVEHGKMQPDVELTKKLEKKLGIKLTTLQEQGSEKAGRGGDAPITLGDAAVKK